MQHEGPLWRFVVIVVFLAALGWPAAAWAQTPSGQARAAQITVGSELGISTTALSDTGTLSGPDARDASQGTGSVGSLLSGQTLHATAIGRADYVASEASIANVAMNVAGVSLGAGFVMSRASAADSGATGSTTIDGLSVNGMAIDVTGSPNQRIELPGALIVINEQQASASGIVVNALHVVVYGIADVLIGSASAAIQ